jgi:hypothetical protein
VADSTKKTSELPVKTSANTSDKILFVYNAANSVTAQTAIITLANLLANTPNLQIRAANLGFTNTISDPANSTALNVGAGTLLFSDAYLYFATGNNVLKRVALSDF